jgi:betaine lipid synthase
VDERNYILGGYTGICIPYYIFLGRLISSNFPRVDLERLDAACTESPYLMPRQVSTKQGPEVDLNIRSKAYRSAIVNLSANLPLPSTFYQNSQYRIYYEEQHKKHTQFGNEFIYAFTWEDSRVDQRLLKINENDVVLCLTSAGDNLLDYLASCKPRRIHAVDLNPNQSHLLELKVAAYQALDYVDFWKMFGEGRLPAFRRLLLEKLSPYLSSQALQFWLNQEGIFSSSRGLYEYGGSGRAMRLIRRLLRVMGLGGTVKKFCSAKTLNEQRELWPMIRRVLLNRVIHSFFIGAEFLWKAAGVPANQAAMISWDYYNQGSLNPNKVGMRGDSGEAMWDYICNTLDPVVRETLISDDNFYYLLTLLGKYTRR